MLQYVSPKEMETSNTSNNILPSLQKEIHKLRNVKQSIHVAILSKDSSFHVTMDNFKKHTFV